MSSESKPERLLSLDAFRGFVMVCLTFGGLGLAQTARLHLEANPDAAIWPLLIQQFEHCQWRGCAFWDLINPAFTFMVGMSMAYSYVRRQREGHSYGRMFTHASIRALVLIVLGVFLMTQGKNEINYTFVNVLTQMGLGYPFLFLCWNRRYRTQLVAAVACLLVTWTAFAVDGGTPEELGPGVSQEWAASHQADIAPEWRKNANIAHEFDIRFLNLFPNATPFEYSQGGYQTLSFIPTLATMIFGLMCGEWVRGPDGPTRKLIGLVASAIGLLIIGYSLDLVGVCPNIKRIWTPSFCLISTGWVIAMLSVFYWRIDVQQKRRWAFPLIVAGSNSIVLYVMFMTLKRWTPSTYRKYFGPDVFQLFGELWVPTVQAFIVGLTFWTVCYWMWRQKLFVRI